MASAAIWLSGTPVSCGRGGSDPRLASVAVAVAVAQTDSAACRGNWSVLFRVLPSGFVPVSAMPGVSFQSRALAVLHVDRWATSASLAL